jgi:hypothetical protein
MLTSGGLAQIASESCGPRRRPQHWQARPGGSEEMMYGDSARRASDTQASSGRLTESAIMMPRLAAGLAAAPDFKAGKAMPTRSRTRRAFANLHETLNWDSELPTLVAAEGPSLRNYAPINLSLIGRSSLPVPANWQPQWQMARGRRCAAGPPPTHSESLAP